jgi:hypothetical protein
MLSGASIGYLEELYGTDNSYEGFITLYYRVFQHLLRLSSIAASVLGSFDWAGCINLKGVILLGLEYYWIGMWLHRLAGLCAVLR